MRKPNSNKIKTVQINVMDNHSNLDDLKANASVTGSNDTVDNSDIDDMKSILNNLKNKHVNDISLTEEEIVYATETAYIDEYIDENVDYESYLKENGVNDISSVEEDTHIDNTPSQYHDFVVEEFDTYIKENDVADDITLTEDDIELTTEPNPYVFDIYEDYIHSHYIHRNIRIRNNEVIKIVIDGHYHNHNKINSWLKSPFNLYINDDIIFSFYGNSEDNTTEIETVILFRTDHVFVNGKAYDDDNLTITHI